MADTTRKEADSEYDRIREVIFAAGIAMIAALIAAVAGIVTASAWLGMLIFAILGALLLAFWFMTRDRIPVSCIVGLEIYWHPPGCKPKKVKIIRVERDEPEYAFVESEGKATTALISELSLTLSQRLKYSWRRS